MRRAERLDAYLDIRNARMAYQEQNQATAQVSEPAPIPKILRDKEANQEKNPEDNDETLGDEEENLGDEDKNLEDANFRD